MIRDITTNKTYSSSIAAIRQIGKKEFNYKSKNNQLQYIQTYYVD